jgi:MFS transporter, FHS family, glucose/mannose:H+ symporter
MVPLFLLLKRSTNQNMYNKKLVFAAACFGMLLFGIGLITLGSMATDLKIKFHLDEVAAGTLFSILPIGILTGSLLFGPVCDRYGYKLLLIISCIVMSAGFEGIAFVSSPVLLKIYIFIFGVSAGVINGATNAVVSDISSSAKGANLSLLGVFFGIGALGMPFLLAILKHDFTSYQIITAVGVFTLAVAIFYSFIKFPPSKKELGFALAKTSHLFRDSYLFFIAFYLFFQGSLEAIVNNWTTSYLTRHLSIEESNALYALSLYVAGMTVMRLLIGGVFRSVNIRKLMIVSIFIVLAGILLLHFGQSLYLSTIALIIVGVGLAAGFPIMLGLAGNRYAAQSGIAFSFIFTVSLLGNMIINYLMGWIAKNYGIRHYTSFAFIEIACMLLLCILIFRKQNKKETYAGETMAE